jgi:MFS family permease
MSLKEAMHTHRYWLSLTITFLIGFGTQSIMLHLVTILKQGGETSQVAAAAQASLWVAMVCGRISTGFLIDRFFAPRVAVVFLLFPVIGIAMLAGGAGGASGFIAAMLVGLAVGAEVDVIAYLVSRYFGLKHYSHIYSTYFALFSLGSGYGPAVTAWFVDRTGSYPVVLGGLVGVLALAAILLLRLPRFATSTAH